MAPSPETLAQQQVRIYNGLVRNARGDLVRILGRLDGKSPEAVRNALLRAMPALATKYGDAAATAAAEVYDTMRDVTGVSGRFTPLLSFTDSDAVERATRRAAGYLWSGEATLLDKSLTAILDLHVKRAGRDTMTNASITDPRSTGWARKTVGVTCLFCQMLATRGAVYKKDTAVFASHHDCDCVAIPSWNPDAPEVNVVQYQASVRTSAFTPEQKADHRDRVKSWTADFEQGGFA